MRIGLPFQLKDIQNSGDVLIPLYTKCAGCGKKFKIVAIEVFATQALYGSRSLRCMSCASYWADAMETLGVESRPADVPVRRVTLIL